MSTIQRAARVETMLRRYASFDPHDMRSNVVDVLADIIHFSEVEGIDFDSALSMAKVHAECEAASECR